MEDSTGGFEVPLTVLAVLLVLGALLVLFAREEHASVAEPELLLAVDEPGGPNRSDRKYPVLE
jgi:hypothetical protein